MHILMPDTSTEGARTVERDLRATGHVVHGCRTGADPCSVLRGEECPLDTAPVDLAVQVGPAGDDPLGHGELCAVRRRIPLILADGAAEHPLAPWAAAVVSEEQVASAVDRTRRSSLPGHTAVARRVLADELRRLGVDPAAAVVEVHRADGGLQVDLWVPPAVGERDAEMIAVHVCQQVRRHDPWARTLDVGVHRTPMAVR